MSRVRQLDDRLLPRPAAWLRRAATTLQAWVDRIPRPEPQEDLPDEVEVPLGTRLRALDDRYARSGPLGFLAEVPQLAAVLVTLLLSASAFTVAARQTPASQQAASPGQPDRVEGRDPSLAFVGIQPGAAVATYIDGARKRLDEITQPDASVVGLMVFDHYVTAAQAAQLADPTRPTRAYYATHGKELPGEPPYAPVVDIARDLPPQLKAAANQLMVLVKQNEQFAFTIAGNNAEERAQKAQLIRDARLWRTEAAVLRGPCACVFAVVVRGKARVLQELARRPGIRLIDPAPPGAQTGLLNFGPLRPEVTGVEPTVGPGRP
ncbi:MAG: hypothetical protein QOJ92_2185 [Frankiales bacterium]|nr:hypothetical protein [Frankiales bacterium]